MSYVKNSWQSGDIITATKLNHMEDGIYAANEGGDTPGAGCFVFDLNLGVDDHNNIIIDSVSKTLSEIISAGETQPVYARLMFADWPDMSNIYVQCHVRNSGVLIHEEFYADDNRYFILADGTIDDTDTWDAIISEAYISFFDSIDEGRYYLNSSYNDIYNYVSFFHKPLYGIYATASGYNYSHTPIQVSRVYNSSGTYYVEIVSLSNTPIFRSNSSVVQFSAASPDSRESLRYTYPGSAV